jgi:inhibitor of cysteine peptidase
MAAGASGSDETILTRERSGETIALRTGQAIRLVLPENPTTGYRWAFTVDGLDKAGDGYAEDAAGLIGGGGARSVHLVATRPGDALVKATLQRSWEGPDKAVDRCEFNFKVS